MIREIKKKNEQLQNTGPLSLKSTLSKVFLKNQA